MASTFGLPLGDGALLSGRPLVRFQSDAQINSQNVDALEIGDTDGSPIEVRLPLIAPDDPNLSLIHIYANSSSRIFFSQAIKKHHRFSYRAFQSFLPIYFIRNVPYLRNWLPFYRPCSFASQPFDCFAEILFLF